MVDQHEDRTAAQTREWLLRGLAKPGKSRAGLAVAAGVSKQAITKWTKTGHISKSNLPKTAEYLNEPLPEWLNGSIIRASDDPESSKARYVTLLDVEKLGRHHEGNADLRQQMERFNRMLKDGRVNGEILEAMLDLVDKLN